MIRLPWKRLATFAGLQVFGAVAPLLVLPVVVRLVGTEGWVGLSIGYAVGAAAAIAVGLAWSMTGPSRVSGVEPVAAAAVFWESVVTRATVVVPVLAVGVVASSLLSPAGHRLLAAGMCVAIAVGGLASNWYYVGRGEPTGIMRYEAIPKLAATVLTIPAVALTHNALLYPVFLLVATLGGAALSARRILGPSWPEVSLSSGSWGRMRHNAVVASSAIVGAGYTSLAVPITQLSGTGLVHVADFAGSLRIRSMAQTAPASSTTALQGWVTEPSSGSARRSRMRTALLINTATGTATGAVVAIASPLFDVVLFGDSVTISPWLGLLSGAACIPFAISSSLSFHVLAPLRETTSVATSRVAATIVGVPLLYVLAQRDGATGAALAVLASECLVVCWQAATALRISRRRASVPQTVPPSTVDFPAEP